MTDLDEVRGELRAERTFDHDRDLWLRDHRPLQRMEHPAISAIMLVEAACEASRLLFPALEVVELRNVEFLGIMSCPLGGRLEVEIRCRYLEEEPGVVCGVSLGAVEQASASAPPSFGCEVAMGARQTPAGTPQEPWVRPSDLDTPPLSRQECLERYERRTALTGRYRLMDRFEGTGADRIAAWTVHASTPDFVDEAGSGYSSSPYVLEALLQTAIFFFGVRQDDDHRKALPTRIGSIVLGRRALEGEPLRVEARLLEATTEGTLWNARALDGKAMVVMELRGLRAAWLGES